MLTGLYPTSHGVIYDERKLNDKFLTLAEVLQNAGYKTAAFTDGGYVSGRYGYQGFDRFDDTGRKKSRRQIEKTYARAVTWLPKTSHGRPFFLFLHTYQVHAPYDPPPAFDVHSDKKYKGVVKVSGSTNRYYKKIESKMTKEDYLYVIDKYDGEIYHTDHFLGKLFKELKDLGLYDESMIIVTSDHGEHFLDHQNSLIRYVGHREHKLYDEIVKVPLIIKSSKLPKGQINDAQVESIDIMPTILGLLWVSIPSVLDGESLIELGKKTAYYGKHFAFSENFFGSERHDYRMIRNNNWKLLMESRHSTDSSTLELYNLKSDPKEQKNLFEHEVEVGKSLFAELNAWMDIRKRKSKVTPTDKIELDENLKEQLKALGYMN
jgi:arylsulfatase A-like enzyme